jgi:hypothetical protein
MPPGYAWSSTQSRRVAVGYRLVSALAANAGCTGLLEELLPFAASGTRPLFQLSDVFHSICLLNFVIGEVVLLYRQYLAS